jgi:hypothetical protein
MDSVSINRAPVLTLWAAVVAERLGFDREEALTLSKAVAGLTAQPKGQRLGIFTPSPKAVRRQRAAGKDQKPVTPSSVEKYLASKFGDALPAVRTAMERLATSREREDLAEEAFRLYEAFRPDIPAGERGWGATGTLSLEKIAQRAKPRRPS